MIKEISDAESRRAHLYTLKGMCVLRNLIISEGEFRIFADGRSEEGFPFRHTCLSHKEKQQTE